MRSPSGRTQALSARCRSRRWRPRSLTPRPGMLRPLVYVVDGEPKEFFTVGQLAVALGRSAGTVCRWERLGIIPVANP